MSRYDTQRGTPMASPLTCREIPYEDAETLAEHDLAAGDCARVKWSMMTAIAGDHTAHAVNERCRVVGMCEERGLTMVAAIEGCHRHGVQLEETNRFEHACPGGCAMDLVRLVVQVLMGLYHRNSPYIYYHLIVRLFNILLFWYRLRRKSRCISVFN